MVFGVCNPRVVTDEESTKISEIDWLRCYSHLVRTQALARTGSYLSTASLLMMLGKHDTEVANRSGLALVKKNIINSLACKIVETPFNPRISDALAGDFRSGTTILITDLMYRIKTQTGTHDLGIGLGDELSWDVDLFKIHESLKIRPIDKFVDVLSAVEDHLEHEVRDEGNVTVDIWLSLQFLHEERPPHDVILENNFTIRFVKAVTDLDAKTSRPILVTLNGDSMFNCMDSITSRLARELADNLRSKGILVATDQRLWRSMYANFGRQFPIMHTQRKGTLGKTAIWAVIEKNLFRQRVFLMCATNREYVSTLNERAYKPEESGIDPALLRNATGPTKTFAIAGGEMQDDDYAQTDATVFQKKDPTTSTRFTRDKRYKVHWVESTLPLNELEPCPESGSYWFPVTKEDKEFLCYLCRNAQTMDEIELNQTNPTFCINCSANCQDHYKKSAPTLGARKAVLMMAARLKIAFEKSGLQYVDISGHFQKWLVFAATSVIANQFLTYGEELMKSVSHMGGVRIPYQQAKEIFKNGRGKQFAVYRECIYDNKAKKKVLVYRLMKDCGNVAYKDFLEQVAVPNPNDRNEIFAHTRMSAEKAGDVIEFWLGTLDIANMAEGLINVFPRNIDPSDFLNGLERALKGFGRVSRTTSTVNDKRRGSFDCTLQHDEAGAVLDLLNDIPDYQSLPNFHCLNEQERDHVLTMFRKKIGFVVDDDDMGEEEAEPEQADASTAAEESALTARQKLLDALGQIYNVSEMSTVCPYCGSTKHDHVGCEHPNKAQIAKTLQGIRKTLEEGNSPTEGDADMGQEGETAEPPEGATAAEEPTASPMDEEPEPAPTRTGEYFWYSSVMGMTEVGDLDESGRFCINGRDVSAEGPMSRDALYDVIREVPADGFLQIVPNTGCHFHAYPFYTGVEFSRDYKFGEDNKLEPYEDEVSTALNRCLRHHAGKVTINPRHGLKCDDAGWINIDDLLKYEAVWRQDRTRVPHTFLAPLHLVNDKRRWDKDEVLYRFQILFRIMFHSARHGRRVREQILAFGIGPDIDRNGETFRSSGLDPNIEIPEEGLLLYPVAVRAPTGHKESTPVDVLLKPSLLSHPLNPTTAMMLPTCFHVTHKDNLKDIWKVGLIPGGKSNSRIFTFFNPHAPWDSRAWGITKSVDTRQGGYAALYIPTETLMNEFGGRLTDSGQIVTNKDIPFSKIRGAWVQDYQQRWIRLIVPSGEEQVVRSGYRSMRTATKASIIRLATQCANAAEQPYDEDTMDVFAILSRFEQYLIPEGGREQYEARQKLTDYILERKPVTEAGCRICPLCIGETPVMLSVCLNCWGLLECHGIRPFRMNQPDDDENEAVSRELDEQIRKAKEEIFKAAVDEAQDQQASASETQSQFDFNPDEVDYTGDDEDMEEEVDVDVEGEVEEEVDVEQEQADEEARQENEKLPAWTRNLDPSVKKMPTDGLQNVDMEDGAAQIFDNSLIVKILQMFPFYYKQRFLMSPKEYYDAMIKNDIGRLDLDGICPYTGEDDEGNLLYPSDVIIKEWFDQKAKRVPWSEEPMFARRPFDCMKPTIDLLMKIEKMLAFLVEAGFTPDRLQFLVPMSRMQGSNEEKAQMRTVISSFLARLLKGTFPDKKHYAYFRHVDEGFEEVIHFTPLIVYLAHRMKERSDEVLITARQSGVILPQDFQAKIDFTMSYASAEAARGKHHRLTNVARNLEQNVVKAAIGDVGDTAAAKMGRAAAAAAAKAAPRVETPKSYAPQHPPPNPAAASSSSASTPTVHVSTSTASVPKAKQPAVKPMPTTAPNVPPAKAKPEAKPMPTTPKTTTPKPKISKSPPGGLFSCGVTFFFA
eukprot:s3097_g8.t1